MAVGESRSELLLWLNATLSLHYTKVEQCGLGAAYCQLMDLIYGDVPMQKVRFDTSSDYDYRNNMKVLQASFSRHRITKSIDVEKLVKCRLQDNLELLQWFKRYWNEHKDVNVEYDPLSRRKGGAASEKAPATSRTPSFLQPSSRRSTLNASQAPPAPRRVALGGSRSSIPPSSGLEMAPAVPKIAQLSKELTESQNEIQTLHDDLREYKLQAETLETERNFYFNKLREIEIFSQNILVNGADVSDLSVVDFVNQVQSILYKPEEGFAEEEEEAEVMDAESF